MTTALANLVAVTPGGDITDEMIAGFYVLFTVEEASVPLDAVHKAFADHKLDTSRLPSKRRNEHVMQDACTKAQRVTQNGHREEVRAQRVGREGDFEIYQMTKHVQDLENRVVNHQKDLRVMYDFKHSELVFEPLDGASLEDHVDTIRRIQTYYDEHQQRLPGRGLRTIVRHYIEEAGAEFIRDGNYFMATVNMLSTGSKLFAHHGTEIAAQAFLEAMKGALRDIYGHEPLFHIIPCVNDEGQRAFLKRKFVENCDQDLQSFRDELLGLIGEKDKRERGYRTDLRARLVQQRKEMDMRRQKFAAILGDTLAELDQNMGLADKALAKFLTEADL